MFCNQCEQTAKGIACTIAGVCGKNEEVADLQDLLIHAMQGLALYAKEGRRLGIIDEATDLFTYEAIFSTLTNVDFDPDRFVAMIKRAVELREAMKAKVAAAGGKTDFTGIPPPYPVGGLRGRCVSLRKPRLSEPSVLRVAGTEWRCSGRGTLPALP